jgi:hypothetical protein
MTFLRAFGSAAIVLRGDADIVRFAAAEMVVFPADCFRRFAHRALCAVAIFRREAADMIRFGRVDSWDAPVPFKDSIPEIAWSNFSISIWALLRLSRSS